MFLLDSDNSNSVEFSEFRVCCIEVNIEFMIEKFRYIAENIQKNNNGNY